MCDLCLATDPAPCWFSQSKPPLLWGGGCMANSQQSTEALSQHPQDLAPANNHDSLEADLS